MPQQMVKTLASKILEYKKDVPLRVGIDGIDAAGKTFLANELSSYLENKGHATIRASIDGFHNPQIIRHRRGSYSPEGYYYDSFNYKLLKQCLLEPLGREGNRNCRVKAFDFRMETKIHTDEITATNDHILIFEGVFLFRREIVQFWDLKIFVDIDFQVSIKRALNRDLYLFGDEKEIIRKYQERYIPGQKLYFGAENPKVKADIVIDNNDFTKPFIATNNSASKFTD